MSLVSMLQRSPVAVASTSCERFCVLRNKPRICLDIRKKTLLPFAIKAVLLLAKKAKKGHAVTNALRKDNMSRRNAGIKWGVTHHIQAARSKVQINASFPFKLKLKYGCKIGVLTCSSEKHCVGYNNKTSLRGT